MTNAKQVYARELFAQYRELGTLQHTICECYGEVMRCQKALLIAGLPGEVCVTDKITERIHTATSQLISVERELQALSVLIGAAQDDVEDILTLIGRNGLQAKDACESVSESAEDEIQLRSPPRREVFGLLNKLADDANRREREGSQ